MLHHSFPSPGLDPVNKILWVFNNSGPSYQENSQVKIPFICTMECSDSNEHSVILRLVQACVIRMHLRSREVWFLRMQKMQGVRKLSIPLRKRMKITQVWVSL